MEYSPEDVIAKAVEPFALKKGRKNHWYRYYAEVTRIVALQKSRWGPQYRLNLAIWPKELGEEEKPLFFKSHISCPLKHFSELSKILGVGILLMLTAYSQFRMSEIAKFPEGFHGYAIIVWNIPEYPVLPVQNRQVIEDFPADGVIITSSAPQYGIARDEYYFVQADGHLIPAKEVSVLVQAPFSEEG